MNSFIESERPRERLHRVELLLAGPVLRRRLLRIVNVVHRDNDAGVCSLRRLRIIFPVICFVYIEMHCIIYFVREFCHNLSVTSTAIMCPRGRLGVKPGTAYGAFDRWRQSVLEASPPGGVL